MKTGRHVREATRVRWSLARPLAAIAAAGLLLASGGTTWAQALVDPALVGPREAPGVLFLQAATYDPASTAVPLSPELLQRELPAAGRVYGIVQFFHPRAAGSLEAIEEKGARVLGYLPSEAWIVSVEAADFGALGGEGVRWVEPYHPGFKISPDLGAFPFRGNLPLEDGRLELFVAPFADADPATLATSLLAAGAEVTDYVPVDEAGGFMVLARPVDILAIASIQEVQWIQESSRADLRNDKTTWVFQSNQTGITPMWTSGLHGEGEVIGHIDSGIDKNHCSFRDLEGDPPGPNHRKLVGWRGSSSVSSHGTHTAGTAAGDQQPVSGSTYRNGMADHAMLTFTDLGLIGTNNLYNYFVQAHGDGGRLHTNSWGNDYTTSYDAWCVAIDKYSRDYEEGVVLFAVTNLSSLKNPENAKSVVGVGGSQQAPGQQSHCTGGTGPTSDGRRKPEVYLPGCSIMSAGSSTSCSWGSMSGTSMASPAVTGAATLVRQYYREGWWPSGAPDAADGFIPSGALIRATILNATVDMTGVAQWPSNKEGWGRLLLDNGLVLAGDTRGLAAYELRNAAGLATGEQREFALRVSDGAQALRITLAFTDVPASLGASYAAVNDLDLVVVDPLGNTYVGNGINAATGQSSSSLTAPDPRNCVEQFALTSPQVGDYVVRVSGTAVNQQLQGFGLVATGGHGNGLAYFDGYGAGLAGSGGFVPKLDGSGGPLTGNTVTVDAADGLGGALAVVLFGDAAVSVPAFGGMLLVGGTTFGAPLVLGGSLGTPGAGTTSFTLPIPNVPALQGYILYMQIAVADSGAPAGIALSAGLGMHVQ